MTTWLARLSGAFADSVAEGCFAAAETFAEEWFRWAAEEERQRERVPGDDGEEQP